MSGLDDRSIPRLARGVRLRWDEVRQKHLLLYPEGALVLNPTAASVLELCDGNRSVGDVVALLRERYPGADVGADVLDLLTRVRERGLVVNSDG